MGIEVYNLGLLPNKYLIPIIIGISVLIIIVTLGFKYIKKLPLKILLSVIEILLIIGSVFSILYLNDTNNFFNNIKATESETNIYYLIVDKDSKYKKLQDLENKEIGIFMNNEKATNKLKEKITFKEIQLNTFSDVITNIKKIDGVYLNSAYYDLICDEVENFNKQVRIIKKIKITSDMDLTNNKVNTSKESFNILISGIDTEGPIGTVSRSDVNMVMTVNPKTKTILLTSIPRDYYVKLATKGAMDKLTHSGLYGIEETTKTIENLLGIDINYHVKVNFTTVVKLVDTLGGITVNSEYSFSALGMDRVTYNYVAGSNNLNGQAALAFARERYSFASGDNQRVKNQQAVLTGIIKKCTSSASILTNYNGILNAIEDNIQTSMSQKDITSLVKMQLGDMSGWTIKQFSLKGSGSSTPVYSIPNSYVYVMVPDQSSVDEAKNQIASVMNGE